MCEYQGPAPFNCVACASRRFGLQKPCSGRAAGQAQAGLTQAMRPSSLDTSCMPGMRHTAAMATCVVFNVKFDLHKSCRSIESVITLCALLRLGFPPTPPPPPP